MNTSFLYPVRVHVEDTDYTGLVYHPNYLKFIERARVEWFTNHGASLSQQAKAQTFYVIRQLTIDYLAPAKLDDELIISSTVTQQGRTQLLFDQTVYNSKDRDCILAHADVKVVCVNRRKKPSRLPADVVEKLNHVC